MGTSTSAAGAAPPLWCDGSAQFGAFVSLKPVAGAGRLISQECHLNMDNLHEGGTHTVGDVQLLHATAV